MRKYLKSTVAMLLAATVLTGNTGVAQSQQADEIRKNSIEKMTSTVKAAEVQQSKVNVKSESKKSTTAKYNKKIRKAYRKFLKGYYENGKAFRFHKSEYKWPFDFKKYDAYYAIYDINNDGKDELILNTDDMHGSSNPNTIFMYYKGKVKCIGMSGLDGYYWGHEKGKLIGECERDSLAGIKIKEGYTTAYYMIKNGKLKTIARFFDNEGWAISDSDKVRRYWIGKKRVSKKKFENFLKKRTGSKNPKRIFSSDKYVAYK